MTGLIGTASLFNTALAAEVEEDMMFTLDDVVITAARYEKLDLEVPATTSVYTEKQLQATGATTVEGALRYATGIVYKAQPTGETGGEFLIRGKRRGTLVLVDGTALNVRTGYYNLDNIALQDVEKIEVIRGGGAVLYGSDTTGGVINIITKKKKKSSVTLSAGNFGIKKHRFTIGGKDTDFGFAYEEIGKRKQISLPSGRTPTISSKHFSFDGGHKEIFSINHKFNENLRLTGDYAQHKYGKSYHFSMKVRPCVYDNRDIDKNEYRVNLEYKKAGLKANTFFHNSTSNTSYLYYMYKDKKSADVLGTLPRKYHDNYQDRVFGLDIQKEIKLNKDIALLGFNVYHEYYHRLQQDKPDNWKGIKQKKQKYTTNEVDYARNVYSFFASLDHVFDDSNSATISARETFTGNSPDGTEYNQFTPQLQYLHKINNKSSLYASLGKSFTLPTMLDMYGRGDNKANENIRPEEGKHYELGFKYMPSRKEELKLAVFKSDVKNFIRLREDKKTGETLADNEDTKNVGVELTYEVAKKSGLSFNAGVSYSNPKFFYSKEKEEGWQRSYGRWHLTSGVAYLQGKWQGSLNVSGLFDRVLESYQEEVKPLVMTNLELLYHPTEKEEIFLNVDNVLNRDDITSHVLSRYLALPFNFQLGYRMSF